LLNSFSIHYNNRKHAKGIRTCFNIMYTHHCKTPCVSKSKIRLPPVGLRTRPLPHPTPPPGFTSAQEHACNAQRDERFPSSVSLRPGAIASHPFLQTSYPLLTNPIQRPSHLRALPVIRQGPVRTDREPSLPPDPLPFKKKPDTTSIAVRYPPERFPSSASLCSIAAASTSLPPDLPPLEPLQVHMQRPSPERRLPSSARVRARLQHRPLLPPELPL
jgi:hypothetical protein